MPGVRIHTPFDPEQSCGLANVGIPAVDCGKLGEHLWNKYKLIVVPIIRDDYKGLRVTPNVYTTLDEVDTFTDRMLEAIKRGVA